MWHMIFPCCLCNMLNMLDSPSTFSTCFCPVSRTDKHGRKQINFEYILQWGPLRVPHDSWIKPKFKFFQKKISRFWLIFKIFEVLNSSQNESCRDWLPNVQLEWFQICPGRFGRVTGRRPDWFSTFGAVLLYSWTLFNEI